MMDIEVEYLDTNENTTNKLKFDRLDVFGKWAADNYDHIQIIEVIQIE